MDLRKLRYFLTVAEVGSISGAAAVLGLAQPALTQSLSRFENEVGLRLLIRTRTGVRLTEGGKLLFEEGRELVARADMVTRTAARQAKGEAGAVSVGYVNTSLAMLPPAIVGFQKAFPQSRVTMQEMVTLEQIKALRTGEIDMGVCNLPDAAAPSWLQYSVLSEQPLRAVLPKSAPEARAESIGIPELAAMGLVLYPPNTGFPSQSQILDAFHRAGAEPRAIHETKATMAMMACVAAGLGAAILPEGINFIRMEGIVFKEIRQPHNLPLIRVALIRRKQPRRKLADRFWRALEEAVRVRSK